MNKADIVTYRSPIARSSVTSSLAHSSGLATTRPSSLRSATLLRAAIGRWRTSRSTRRRGSSVRLRSLFGNGRDSIRIASSDGIELSYLLRAGLPGRGESESESEREDISIYTYVHIHMYIYPSWFFSKQATKKRRSMANWAKGWHCMAFWREGGLWPF